MGVEIEIGLPGDASADALAVLVTEPPSNLAGDVRGHLQQVAESGELRGARGEALLLHVNGSLPASRLVAVGIGKRDAVDAEALRAAGAAAASRLTRVGGTLSWLLDESLPVPLPEQAAALIEGTILGAYSPGRWKSDNGDAPRPIVRIAIAHAETEELRAAADRAALLYDPPEVTNKDVVLGFVGKSITFDAGGISLKPAANMEDMKGDMAGGAGTLHGIGAVAALGLPVRAIAVLAAAENLPGGDAFRPGDILRAANGKTIEIINTDAEGRLVLADALWYARREGATHVIDLATLTGAMSIALGDLYAGYFANDDDWRDRIAAAGARSGDLVWPFPLHPRYRRYVDSDYADMKNGSTLREGSPVLAAEFLQEFAGEGPWAHVDMAGPGFLSRSRGDYYRVAGGTGYGVRLLAELASSFA